MPASCCTHSVEADAVTGNVGNINASEQYITLRLRNDLYCVEWGVKLYSLTQYITQVAFSYQRVVKLPAYVNTRV